MLFGIFNYTKKHIQKYMMRVFVLKVLRGGEFQIPGWWNDLATS